jgi:hypothetical protein
VLLENAGVETQGTDRRGGLATLTFCQLQCYPLNGSTFFR